MKNNLKTVSKAALVAIAMSSATAIAGTATSGNIAGAAAFDGFYQTVKAWTTGALGTGIAITMTLLGGAIGVAKNSPMPALTGLAGAAFLHWGPQIIEGIMGYSGTGTGAGLLF